MENATKSRQRGKTKEGVKSWPLCEGEGKLSNLGR